MESRISQVVSFLLVAVANVCLGKRTQIVSSSVLSLLKRTEVQDVSPISGKWPRRESQWSHRSTARNQIVLFHRARRCQPGGGPFPQPVATRLPPSECCYPSAAVTLRGEFLAM